MSRRRDLVVVGASLGGLDALCTIAAGLPGDFAAAMMIVLHTSPSSPMTFARVLARHTGLAVAYAEQGGAIVPGRITFARPDLHLTVLADGVMGIDAGPLERFSRPAADALFRSAASVYRDRTIGVVLTGGDGDGTDGSRAIKAAGGLTVVQDPGDSLNPSMPRSALVGDSPDFCIPADAMADLLVRLTRDGASHEPDRDRTTRPGLSRDRDDRGTTA